MYSLTLKCRNVKKSRKRKPCDWCGCIIEIDMPKVCSSNIYDGDFHYSHMHTECEEALHLSSDTEEQGFEYHIGEFYRGSVYSKQDYITKEKMKSTAHNIPYHQIYKNKEFAVHYDNLIDALYGALSNELNDGHNTNERYLVHLSRLQEDHQKNNNRFWNVSPTPEDRDAIIKLIINLQSV